jgi:hypothetical protein
MRDYVYAWTGPFLFLATLMIGILDRGTWSLLSDGTYLMVFGLQHFKVLTNRLKLPHLALVYSIIWILNKDRSLLNLVSLLIASGITLEAFKALLNKEKELKSLKSIANFYEKIIKDNLVKICELDDKLSTLIYQPLPDFLEEREKLDIPHFEDLEEDQDLPKVPIKKEPLRRLRKITVTQTTFFDA